MPQPTLYTPRLRLRLFTLADAPRLHFLLQEPRIAATTAVIPHPYPEGEAERWISTHADRAASGLEFAFAITLAGTRTPGRETDPTDTGHLIGTISISRQGNHNRAVFGYWIGTPYWNRGFATEAAHAILAFAFTKLAVHRVSADHFANNAASGRVLQKIGMTREGLAREAFLKNGQYLEVVNYAILLAEWQKRQRTPRPPVSIRASLQHA